MRITVGNFTWGLWLLIIIYLLSHIYQLFLNIILYLSFKRCSFILSSSFSCTFRGSFSGCSGSSLASSEGCVHEVFCKSNFSCLTCTVWKFNPFSIFQIWSIFLIPQIYSHHQRCSCSWLITCIFCFIVSTIISSCLGFFSSLFSSLLFASKVIIWFGCGPWLACSWLSASKIVIEISAWSTFWLRFNVSVSMLSHLMFLSRNGLSWLKDSFVIRTINLVWLWRLTCVHITSCRIIWWISWQLFGISWRFWDWSIWLIVFACSFSCIIQVHIKRNLTRSSWSWEACR